MKLEPRTGRVTKLTGKRRKPWCAKVYVGSVVDDANKTVRYKYKSIGYYAKKSEAYKALLNYEERPEELDSIPLSRVYKEWSSVHYDRIKDASVSQYKNAWNHIALLHDRDIRTLKTADIERAVENDDPPITVRANIKILLSMVYKYALAHDYCEKDYSALIDLKGDKHNTKIERKVFTAEEVKALRERDDVIADALLTAIYTGIRPNELYALKLSEIDFDTGFLRIAGSKTKAGFSRLIPVHPDIYPILQRNAAKSAFFGHTEVFYWDDEHPLARKYYSKRIGDHTPHDTRHTFITYAKQSGMDQLAVKRIVGHSSEGVTESVYTHLDEDFLKSEMAKFKVE
nr:MAG TPA: Integrase [Bacteriophage sp.]